MEWSAKSPSTWDWENHNLFSGSESGNNSSKKLISASIDSSSKSPIETVEDLQPNGQNKSKDLTSAELSLKLGKRTYFEDVCAGNNNMIKNSNSSTTKKIRASQLSSANYRCQVEGCNVDLSGAKDYHRKHRVCDVHSKCSKVVVAGQERRFCQQCSRFHDLLEFDHKKRSCRRRLSDHNARRRKPQEETISFNSSSYCSPFHEDRRQVGFVLNKPPFSIMRQNVSSTWNDSCGFSFIHSKRSCTNKPVKVGRTNEHVQLSNTGISNLIPSLAFDTDKLVHFKCPTHDILGKGIEEESVSASSLDRSAPSLLSADSWFSSNLAQSNLPQLIRTNPNNGLDGYWKYGATQPQETHPEQACVTPFEHHNSNGGSQFETPFFDSNQILSKPNFLF